MHFYERVVRSLRARGWLAIDDAVLVLAGGKHDRECLLKAGLQNVTISNLSPHNAVTDYAPFNWQKIDAEKIDLSENSVDWAFIHAGLHHLAVPAMGVCEMFRVARKGVLCIEARDSALMRLAVKGGLTSEHELEAVYLTGGREGGYRYGPIPNYVYRWTEREFEKVINSFAPSHRHKFFYEYGFSVPVHRFAMARNPMLRAAGWGIGKAARLAETIIPRQGNQFAFGAMKNVSLQPWLDESLRFRDTYLSAKYDKSKYSGDTKPV